MKADIANVHSGNQRHTEGLDRAIEVLIVERVFIVPHTGAGVSHFITHKPNAIVAWIGFDLIHCSPTRHPGLDGGLHSHRVANSRKIEIGGACDIKLPIRGIVKHVTLVGMRLAPGVLVWTKISGFAEIGCPRILSCVQVTAFNSDPVRHAVVLMAIVVVGGRWKGSGEGIDPGTRTDAVLVAVQA